MKKIILIVGKTCVGKDTLVKKIQDKIHIKMAISFTTRPQRLGEIDGVEYNFISPQELNKLTKEGKIAESTSYNVVGGDTWYYGLSKSELEKDDYIIAIVNPKGAETIKKLYGHKVVTILITANDKERIKRYIQRDDTDNVAECCRRFLADEKDFENFKADYTIDNYDLEISTMRLYNYINMIKGNNLMKETQEDFIKNPTKFLGEI